MLLLPPSPEQLEHIHKVRNENPETRHRDLEATKKWLLQQPHLPDTWDDERLLSFLRGCNFSLEMCKRKLDMYFTFRAAIPEFFAKRDIRSPEMQEILKITVGAVVPHVTPDGRRVTIAKPRTQDFETPNMSDLFKFIFMVADLRLKYEKTNILGDVLILDSGFPLAKHFLKVNLMTIRKFLVVVQESWPLLIKEVHVVNAPPFIAFVLNALKPFLGDLLRDAIHVHTDLETLYEFVPKEILPEEYGGTAGNVLDMMSPWLKKMEEETKWFEDEDWVKADEKKRPGKPLVCDDLFGFEGSFRQLNID